MTRRATLFLSIAALAINGRAAFAQTLSVSGTPGMMHVTGIPTAGAQPAPIGVAGGTYTVTTPGANRTYAITAQLNANMPVGATMAITLAAPAGVTSLGAVALDVTARNVITGIGRNANFTQNISYTFTATAAAGVVPISNRTVTLTIVRFP